MPAKQPLPDDAHASSSLPKKKLAQAASFMHTAAETRVEAETQASDPPQLDEASRQRIIVSFHRRHRIQEAKQTACNSKIVAIEAHALFNKLAQQENTLRMAQINDTKKAILERYTPQMAGRKVDAALEGRTNGKQVDPVMTPQANNIIRENLAGML